MKTIAFFSQKGGSGKTTLAVYTAVAAAEEGESVAIIDTDRQKNATAWGQHRELDTPIIATAPAIELPSMLALARGEGVSLSIVDSAPHAAPDAVRIAELVDMVIIPCRPSANDIAAMTASVNIVKAAKVKAAFVLSACPFRAPEIAETRSVLEDFGLPVSSFEITDLRAHLRAFAKGQGVTEFDTNSHAAEEIRDLWRWIHGELHGIPYIKVQEELACA